MGKISLLDCTLRDGGYVNDWQFGEDTIRGFGKKIAQTGIEMFEVGFLKGDHFDKNRSVFPDLEAVSSVICPKSSDLIYVGMIDMNEPLPLERLTAYDGSSVDMLRIIFKKDKLDEAYAYCKQLQGLGYKLSVNFVGTDLYSDKEFIEGIEKFNALQPFAMAIVDSFGLIKRKQFLRLVYIADHNMAPEVTLCYHAHNNLQQAFGNAEALVEMNLKRDLCIDACVFGMGRGAGNLNLELFAGYMNDNYDTGYRIEPMLEIMDEYLNDIYQKRFWGYSLPFYLSASTGCHPNYAIYFAEKDSLPVKAFHELLSGIPKNEKARFCRESAEIYYREYQENYIDDKETLDTLAELIQGRTILFLAPGSTLSEYDSKIRTFIQDKKPVVFALNFDGLDFDPDYIFSSNMRRYAKLKRRTKVKFITTSNMKECQQTDYVVNFSSYASKEPEILDNSGIMALKLMIALGVRKIYIAGMDGYSADEGRNYVDSQLECDFSSVAELRNTLISKEMHEINQVMQLEFLTPTSYQI